MLHLRSLDLCRLVQGADSVHMICTARVVRSPAHLYLIHRSWSSAWLGVAAGEGCPLVVTCNQSGQQLGLALPLAVVCDHLVCTTGAAAPGVVGAVVLGCML